MGFFKKITRPISRVLDKIIPNEIKPALPYLSAAAPFFGPTSAFMGTGIRRLALGGGFNLASQLAQEGNEGEVNPLSLGLATLTAGMTDTGAANYLESLKTPYTNISGEPVASTGSIGSGFGAPRTGMQKFKDSALDYGIKGVNKIQGLQEAVDKGGMFSKEGAQLASIPITQGTMDNAYAQQNLLNKQSIIDDALGGLSEGFSNEDASNAIRLSMLQYGFTEDEIVETITSAGYKAGGRVGKMNGGIMNAKRGLVNAPGGYAGDIEFAGIEKAVQKADKKLLEEINNSPMSNEGTPQMYASDSAGTIGLKNGEGVEGIVVDQMIAKERPFYQLSDFNNEQDYGRFLDIVEEYKSNKKNGGIIGLNMGGSVLPSGGEMDYRAGGFIPMGSKERADDVPARLSKNEFVMTADAVKAAGGGSVNQGAKRMYDLMNNLEARA